VLRQTVSTPHYVRSRLAGERADRPRVTVQPCDGSGSRDASDRTEASNATPGQEQGRPGDACRGDRPAHTRDGGGSLDPVDAGTMWPPRVLPGVPPAQCCSRCQHTLERPPAHARMNAVGCGGPARPG
jgi:hypothetical protein